METQTKSSRLRTEGNGNKTTTTTTTTTETKTRIGRNKSEANLNKVVQLNQKLLLQKLKLLMEAKVKNMNNLKFQVIMEKILMKHQDHQEDLRLNQAAEEVKKLKRPPQNK